MWFLIRTQLNPITPGTTMSHIRFLFAILAISTPAVALAQSDAAMLKFQYPDGRVTDSMVETEIKQTLEMNGLPVKTSNATSVVVRTECGKRDSAGMISLTQATKDLKADLDLGMAQIKFDSAKPDADPGNPQLRQITDAMKFAVKAEKTITLDKNNQAVKAELPEGLEVPAGFENEYQSDQLIAQFENSQQVLPGKALKKGETWERESETPLGSGQVMTFKKKYTYEGVVEKEGRKLHKITSTVSDVDFQIANSPLPVELKKADLKPAESKQEILFDNTTGIVYSDDSRVRITGELTFEFGGQELGGKLDLTMASKQKSKVVK